MHTIRRFAENLFSIITRRNIPFECIEACMRLVQYTLREWAWISPYDTDGFANCLRQRTGRLPIECRDEFEEDIDSTLDVNTQPIY